MANKATNNPDIVQDDTIKSDLPVKRKRGRPKGSGKGKGTRPDRTVQTEPGENTRFLNHDIKLMSLPGIDLNDNEQVKTRVNQYFSICAEDDIKPSIESFVLSIHASRHDLFNWLNGRSNRIKNIESIRTLKATYDIITSYYAHLMNNGKINPVSGIFMMKNNLSYKDTTDYVISSNQDNQLSISDISDKAGLLTDD